jgi:carboxypeptidase family protein/TonB-dependent receptor-like protein
MRLLLAVLYVLAAAAASAQPRTGSIAGTVTGDDGNHLPGVTVTVQDSAGGFKRTATTDVDGRFVVTDVPMDGEYIVHATLIGFAPSADQHVTLGADRRATSDFVLRVTLLESVAVTARSPLLEEDQSRVQQTISDRLVHSLPLVGRNFLPLASLAAGFTGNPLFPNPQGQYYWTNNVLVDGASHFSKWRSAPRTFYSGYSLEAIKEVRVMTSRFSAEYGDALATVTTALTRSGDDTYHGSALMFVQNSAFDSPPAFAPDNPPSDTERFGFTLGGPLTKDRERTHFLESYEGRRSRTRNIVVSPAAAGASVPDNEDEHLIFFRVDHHPTPNHLLMSRYNGQFLRWHSEHGGLDLPGTGIAYTNDVHTWLTTDRRSLGRDWLNDLRFQFARFTDLRRDLQPTVFVSRAGYSQQGGQIGPVGFGAEPEDTWEAADTVSYLSGRHALRLGGGFKYVRDHNPAMNFGRGAYFFAGAPANFPRPYLYVQSFAPTAETAFADPRSTSMFGFVQDDFRITGSTTLNLGVRYDVDRISNVRNYTASTDTNNIQPRVGIAWRPLDRTIVRGGVGMYTQQHLLYYINRVQIEGADGLINITLPPESGLFPTFPAAFAQLPPGAVYPPRDIQVLDPSFRNPYSIQSTAGIERGFGALTLAADYVYLNGHDLMSLVDTNAPASIVKPDQRTVTAADAARPIRPVAGGFRNIVSLGNEGRSWYHALQVKAERRIGALEALASYTLAHSEDMLNYQLPEDSRNLAAEKGPANADVRHNLTVGATWAIPGNSVLWRDWVVSGIGAFRSARPYTITWGDDRNGTTQNDARPDGRNTVRGDGYQNIDLALTRRFTRGSTQIEARAEAFNVLDRINYDEFVGALSSPFYRQPISAFPTRRIQLAAIVRF